MSEIKLDALTGDSLETTKERVMSANNANEIYEHIKQLGNDPKHRQRWIWELMQNAQDVAIDGEVAVEINFDGSEVCFSHNGLAFTDEDITHLIYHGSSKPGLAGKTGKFGTGFMTTHLLSRQVRVKGCLTDGRYFNFILDREAKDGVDMLTVLDNSWMGFKQSLTDTGTPGITSYTYLALDEKDVLATVDPVMDSLEDLLPAVMAFSGIIKEVRVVEKGTVKTFSISESVRAGEVIINSSASDQQSVFLISEIPDQRTKIAIPMNGKGRILPVPKEVARLFITFPLVGTNLAFPLPFLIHSQDFEPSKEREKIWIETDTKETAINKKILEAAFTAYCDFCTLIASDAYYSDIHLLADLGAFPSTDWLDLEWYKDQLETVFTKLDQLPLLTNNLNKEKIALSDSIVPYCAEEFSAELWTAWNYLSPHKVPDQEMAGYWRRVVRERMSFDGGESHPSAYTLADLCSTIDKTEENRLALLEPVGIEPLEFLVYVVQLIERSGEQGLWSEYAILANQNGVLRKSGALNTEESGVDEISGHLKDIARGLVLDIRSILVDPAIKIVSADHQLQLYKKSTLINSLVEKVKAATLGDASADFQHNSILLLEWLLANGRSDTLPGFPVMLGSGEWEKISLGTDRLLAPVAIWPEAFQRYKKLFPDDFLLDDAYAFVFEQVELLSRAKDWLQREPLYYRQETIRPENIRHLVTRREDRDRLAASKGEEWTMEGTIEMSQIAYFSRPKDKSIIDRARKSVSRTQLLLEFIIEVLLAEDQKGQQRTDIKVVSGEEEITVGVVPSLWMRDIKVRDWVKSGAASSYADKPSVESLLPYFDNKVDNMKLYQSLQRPEVARWLHFLDIGVGDLLRNIRSGDNEEEKMDWDQSYVSILMNPKLDPASVTAMLGDDDLISMYRQKKHDDDLRQKNKEIGTLVEEAFEKAFEQLPGYSIRPEKIGSDFVVEYDYDHYLLLERPDKKVFTIEIKSSRAAEVKMSKKQGETAQRKKENYILCVVPLDGGEINAEYVIDAARFVTDIAQLLDAKVTKVIELDRMKDAAAAPIGTGQIWTAIEGMEVRYCIGHRIWERDRDEVLTFDEFVSEKKV